MVTSPTHSLISERIRETKNAVVIEFEPWGMKEGRSMESLDGATTALSDKEKNSEIKVIYSLTISSAIVRH